MVAGLVFDGVYYRDVFGLRFDFFCIRVEISCFFLHFLDSIAAFSGLSWGHSSGPAYFLAVVNFDLSWLFEGCKPTDLCGAPLSCVSSLVPARGYSVLTGLPRAYQGSSSMLSLFDSFVYSLMCSFGVSDTYS